jgi:hypothetical protein
MVLKKFVWNAPSREFLANTALEWTRQMMRVISCSPPQRPDRNRALQICSSLQTPHSRLKGQGPCRDVTWGTRIRLCAKCRHVAFTNPTRSKECRADKKHNKSYLWPWRGPSGLWHELYSPPQTLRSWVRISLEAWMSECIYSVIVLPSA